MHIPVSNKIKFTLKVLMSISPIEVCTCTYCFEMLSMCRVSRNKTALICHLRIYILCVNIMSVLLGYTVLL